MSERLLRRIAPEDLADRAPRALDSATVETARAILADIDAHGETAVIDHATRLGDLRPGERFAHSPESLRAAYDRLPGAQREILHRVADRIRAFAAAQRNCLRDLAFPVPGGQAGHTCIPVGSAGCYAPGGRFPLPSSVLMTAVVARAAGVPRVWVASPRPADATLAAAHITGADGLLAIGGAQAIGALTYGHFGAPACDMIVGPGNRWVTAAKQIVSARVGIDMLAGPSELVVLADDSADPEIIAADLLAQAEHDDDAVPILITTSEPLLALVDSCLRTQLRTLPTRASAEAALRNGFAILARDSEDAACLCDRIGPEHLELLTRDAAELAARITNAGAVFIGSAAAEVLGDYGAGPNHVLPTGGTSRFRAGLSVFTFLRARTWLRIDDPGAAEPLRRDASVLARMESLEAHARAAEVRSRGASAAS